MPYVDENGKVHKKELQHKKGWKHRKMDWSKVQTTRIALKFSYIGKKYNGLVIQTNEAETVEQKLFEALKKCCLVDPDPESKI